MRKSETSIVVCLYCGRKFMSNEKSKDCESCGASDFAIQSNIDVVPLKTRQNLKTRESLGTPIMRLR